MRGLIQLLWRLHMELSSVIYAELRFSDSRNVWIFPLFFQMSEVLVGTDGGAISLDSERALVEISLIVWRKWSAKALV